MNRGQSSFSPKTAFKDSLPRPLHGNATFGFRSTPIGCGLTWKSYFKASSRRPLQKKLRPHSPHRPPQAAAPGRRIAFRSRPSGFHRGLRAARAALGASVGEADGGTQTLTTGPPTRTSAPFPTGGQRPLLQALGGQSEATADSGRRRWNSEAKKCKNPAGFSACGVWKLL